MTKSGSILALDQGTTSSRAIVFGAGSCASAGSPSASSPSTTRPRAGSSTTPRTSGARRWRPRGRPSPAPGSAAGDIAAVGITNQRETCLVWDRRTGKPIHRAIVWQDRRTADMCRTLKEAGHEPTVTAKTGLLLDPYFSATKIAWLLDHVEGARALAEAGHLAFGTVDTFLIWRLTGGRVHATDATNASRTLLYDIAKGAWDDDLLKLFDVPRALLPEVRDCNADFGTTEASILGAALPILGVAGDQQAATIGQACFAPGMVKATYGTGCFALLNTGEQACRLEEPPAHHGRLSARTASAPMRWRARSSSPAPPCNGCATASRSSPRRPRAARSPPTPMTAQDVYLVPAFVGLGAPYWQPEARGALFGLTRGTGPAEIARAALEAVCFQTRDLLEAMHGDWGARAKSVLRVDGGMVASDWTMQRLADILDAPVERPVVQETTALGAAWLAGHKAGVWPDAEGFAKLWKLDRAFSPALAAAERERKYAGWKRSVAAVLGHAAGR